MNLTRNCLLPWQFIIVHAGGLMCPCCAMNDADYGDFLLDYAEPNRDGKAVSDVFNNEAIQRMKQGLLTGNLTPMCQNCVIIEQKLITTVQLKENLLEYLKRRKVTVTEETDLSSLYAYERAGIGVTNRCNLRCTYCNQSLLAETNPYFKVDFPMELLSDSLEYLAATGIDMLETGAFGEATIHPKWCEIFTDFHKNHPNIKLFLTTNLSKKYTEEEILLLAQHYHLRISLDTMDAELFSQIRKNGKLSLVLENINRIEDALKKYNLEKQEISIDSVICNLTWKSVPEVSEFAFSHGFIYCANNYEKRPNSTGYLDGSLQMIEELPIEEQMQVKSVLLDVKEKAEANHYSFFTNGNISEQVELCYHRFIPYDENPVYRLFYQQNPLGKATIHFDIVYDHFHTAYTGILLSRDECLCVRGGEDYDTYIIREVAVFKKGKNSPKYDQTVLPGYRKKVFAVNGQLNYSPDFKDENVEYILVEILDFWKAHEGEMD